MRKLNFHRVSNTLKVLGLLFVFYFICFGFGATFNLITGKPVFVNDANEIISVIWYHPFYAGIGFVLLIVLVILGALGYLLFDYIAPKSKV